MSTHTISLDQPKSSSIRYEFDQLKDDAQTSPQWIKKIYELRKRAKDQNDLLLWIEISNSYIENSTRNTNLKDALLVLNELLDLLNQPFWDSTDKTYLKLRGKSMLTAGRLYNALNFPDTALTYLNSGELIAKSIQAEFLLVLLLMEQEVSLNYKHKFKHVVDFRLKNIEFYKKHVEKQPEHIDILMLAYANLASNYAHAEDSENQQKYIKKAYNLAHKASKLRTKVHITCVFIIYSTDLNPSDQSLVKAQNLFNKLEQIDKSQLDDKVMGMYTFTKGYIQTAGKDYKSAKENLKKVLKNTTYSHQGKNALEVLLKIAHFENDWKGMKDCFDLQDQMLKTSHNDIKARELARQEALHKVEQLKLERDYNEKVLNAERTLRKNIEEKQEKILQLNEELNYFAGMVAHDLKAPLRTIDSFLDLIHKENKEILQEKDRKFFEFIFDATDQMTHLVDKLLSHAKMGGIGIDLGPVQLNDQLLKVKANLQAAIQEKKATIDVAPLPQVNGEPTYLIVLFQNLLSNAIKFTPKDRSPSIQVQSEETETHFEVYIKDNGIGIPKEQLEKVTKPFFRVHNQSKYKGAGLGLATCQKIMNIHQGSLSVESEGGKGSIFTLKFPKKKEQTY